MKRTFLCKIGLIGLAAVGCLLGVELAQPVQMAQAATKASNTLVVSPMSQKLILKPGEEYRARIKVSNPATATAPLYYAASAAPYSVTDKAYTNADFVAKSNYTQIADWISFDQTEGTVEPNQATDVAFTIKVPKNAPAGGQYAAIKILNNSAEHLNKTDGDVAIQDSFEVASIIYATVTGTTRDTASVLENKISGLFFGPPLSATSLIENTGNVHAEATYVLQVWPLFSDEEIYTNEESPETHVILPGTKRLVSNKWDGAPSIGLFKMRQTIKVFGQNSTTERIVLLCPMWLLLILVFVVFLSIFYLVFRSRKRRAAAKNKVAE